MVVGQKQKMSKSEKLPVSATKRSFGWMIAAIAMLMVYVICRWLEDNWFDIHGIVGPLIIAAGTWGIWLLGLFLIDEFDLLGSRRKK